MITQKLPLEILYRIFTFVHRKDLEVLMYVCKKWHYPSKSIYLEHVFWDRKKTGLLKQYLTTMDENMQTFRPLPMTKRLTFYDPNLDSDVVFSRVYHIHTSLQLTKREFLFLLALFPNLSIIDMEQWLDAEHHLEILYNCQPEELPPQSFEEINIKSDSIEDGEDFRMKKFAVYYQFRQSIKSMHVAYLEHLFLGKSVLELLPDFKNLNALKIYNDNQPGLSLFQLLQACPLLSSLSYTSASDIFQNTDHQIEDFTDGLDNQHLNISYYLRNLKELKPSMPNLTASFMELFTSNFLKNLSDLELHLTGTGMYRWIDRVTMNIALEFCKSVQNIPFVQLTFSKERLRDDRDIDSFYHILNTLTGERAFHTRTCNHTEGFGEEEGVSVCMSGSKLWYRYCHHFASLDAIHIEHEFPSALTQAELAKVNELDILADDEDGQLVRALDFYLEPTQALFPNITKLQLQLPYYDFFLRAKSLSGSNAALSLENMTYVYVEEHQHWQDIIVNLPTYFQTIEVLSLGPVIVEKLIQEQTTLDLTKYNALKTLILDIYHIEEEGLGEFLALEYTGVGQQTERYSLMETDTEDDILSKEQRDTHTIIIKGSEQLNRIVLEHKDVIYAELDLHPLM